MGVLEIQQQQCLPFRRRLSYRSLQGWILFLLAFLGAVDYSLGEETDEVAETSLVVFLVRHAEKLDSTENPRLSKAGKTRARNLTKLLRDAKLRYVHSTNYARTRDTAAGVAKLHGVKIKTYDHNDQLSLVRRIQKTRGRHLIVGHSSSIPQLLRLLGADPGKRIDVASEYDRLYVVSIDRNGIATTVLMRYGKPYKAH